MITLFNIRPKGFNIGNDAIYIGMQHFLYKAFGEIVNIITLPATSRYENQPKAGLTVRTVYEVNQYGHGVIVGGGNIYENGELDIDLNALHALEVPMMLFSLSGGKVYNRNLKLVDRTDAMPKNIIIELNKKAKYSLVRDKATYDYLQSLGCTESQIGGCPTMCLDYIENKLPEKYEELKNVVLISVRNPNLMSIPLEKQRKVYNDILNIISFFHSKKGKDVKLLCHDHRDIEFAASFENIEYIYTGDIFTYLGFLRSCALNVTYRLHSFIPCLVFGTPTIIISYDQRALSLVDTIGFGEWNINMIYENNVIERIIDRYSCINDLDDKKNKTRPVWEKLYSTMNNAFRNFAMDVQNFAQKK